MSTKIGQLNLVNRGSFDELHGEINTLNLNCKLKLVPVHRKTSDNAPDYEVFIRSGSSGDINAGGAWKKSKQQPDGSLFEFLSLTIDDMSFDNPLNVAAFKNNEGGWDITWRRRSPKQNTETQAA